MLEESKASENCGLTLCAHTAPFQAQSKSESYLSPHRLSSSKHALNAYWSFWVHKYRRRKFKLVTGPSSSLQTTAATAGTYRDKWWAITMKQSMNEVSSCSDSEWSEGVKVISKWCWRCSQRRWHSHLCVWSGLTIPDHITYVICQSAVFSDSFPIFFRWESSQPADDVETGYLLDHVNALLLDTTGMTHVNSLHFWYPLTQK